MSELVVIVPSRGRPEAAATLIQAFGATRTTAQLVFAIDEDDPRREEYWALAGPPVNTIESGGAPATMVLALNASAVSRAMADAPPFALGFMGDDHMPRTKGWDQAYLDALHELGTGIVYGNDLLQGHRLPTQCAMTSDIVRALGFMAPPSLKHLYVDNFWRDLGKAADCLRYLPDVIVEHRHPIAGKAPWDENYQRVNAPEVGEHDRKAYEAYLYGRDGFESDVAKVKALREVMAS